MDPTEIALAVPNFRDVSHTINNPPDPPLLKPSLLYRSAIPTTATPAARARLSTIYAIKTILDLRTDTEILDDQKQLPNRVREPSSPQAIPSIPTTPISLNGSGYTRALLKRLSYVQTAQLGLLYALSYRTQAISILGRNVMSKRGLSGLAIDTLTHSTAEIASIFTLLAEPATYPILVHCTQGKDRTGLVVLLVCLLCGASEDAVRRDYEVTDVALAEGRKQREREIGRIGLPASFAGCEEGWVHVVCAWLKEEWGGVEGYLVKGCGIGIGTLEGVRRILRA